MKKVILYTDGACSYNPGPGGWGCVLIYKDIIKELSGFEDNTTNNRMELTAIIKGLEALKEKVQVSIYSDSAYICNAFNENWIQNWKNNNWKNSNKKEVLNKDLWERLLELFSYHKCEIIKVKGHSTDIYNNKCDELATTQIKNNIKK